MPEAVIADASCLIVLANIERLELLHAVYGRLFTTPEIAAEFGEGLPPWIELARVKDGGKQQVLQLQIDKGEASAIALAMEMPRSLLILDDLKARHIATRLGLRHTGTLGVVVKAKLNGHLEASNLCSQPCRRPIFAFPRKLKPPPSAWPGNDRRSLGTLSRA